jgi:hypothetical protein
MTYLKNVNQIAKEYWQEQQENNKEEYLANPGFDGRTIKYGTIGDKLKESRSPEIRVLYSTMKKMVTKSMSNGAKNIEGIVKQIKHLDEDILADIFKIDDGLVKEYISSQIYDALQKRKTEVKQ